MGTASHHQQVDDVRIQNHVHRRNQQTYSQRWRRCQHTYRTVLVDDVEGAVAGRKFVQQKGLSATSVTNLIASQNNVDQEYMLNVLIKLVIKTKTLKNNNYVIRSMDMLSLH